MKKVLKKNKSRANKDGSIIIHSILGVLAWLAWRILTYDYKAFSDRLFNKDELLCQKITKWSLNVFIFALTMVLIVALIQIISEIVNT